MPRSSDEFKQLCSVVLSQVPLHDRLQLQSLQIWTHVLEYAQKLILVSQIQMKALQTGQHLASWHRVKQSVVEVFSRNKTEVDNRQAAHHADHCRGRYPGLLYDQLADLE
uniref:(northern house mosquito) hypothetical protein n=1 Tax=Culex pipiens TaxID=7175 RepID=A0A8D8N0Y5_CULPI